MNWISNLVRPKIRSFLRRETPENLWIKCPETGQLVFYKDVEANQFVIPNSNYHMRISAPARLKAIFDGGECEDIPLPEVPLDPLKFRDERRYADRLKDARSKQGMSDAIKVGIGRLEGLMVTIGVPAFDLLGGSPRPGAAGRGRRQPRPPPAAAPAPRRPGASTRTPGSARARRRSARTTGSR